MQPYLTANLAVLDELYDALVAFLRPLDDDCLNWSPLPEATNSIAALVTHLTGATTSWFARAVEESLKRDRDAEFHVRSSAAELIATVERGRAEARRLVALIDALDPATTRAVRRLSQGHDATVSIAWCVEHAIIHAGEHWGQIQLTQQLYLADRGGTGLTSGRAIMR